MSPLARVHEVSVRRPTQQSVEEWKARTAIHSLTDIASLTDVAPSPSLPLYLCYSCHTTLTSKNSRSIKTLIPDPSSTTSTVTPPTVNLPTWSTARLAFEMEDDQNAGSTARTSGDEIWETRKLDAGRMKSLVSEFLLDQ
jgi:cytoplasmic tRNA 2-thiolation protein 2